MLSAKIVLVVMTALPLVTLFGSMPSHDPLDGLGDVETQGESCTGTKTGRYFRAERNAVPATARGQTGMCVRTCMDYSNTPSCAGTATPVNQGNCECLVDGDVGFNGHSGKTDAGVLKSTRIFGEPIAKNYPKRIPGCHIWNNREDNPSVKKIYFNTNTNGKGRLETADFWQVCHCDDSAKVDADAATFTATDVAADGTPLKCPVIVELQTMTASYQQNELGYCWNTDGNQFKDPDTNQPGALCSHPCNQAYGKCKALGDYNTGACNFISYGTFGTPPKC